MIINKPENQSGEENEAISKDKNDICCIIIDYRNNRDLFIHSDFKNVESRSVTELSCEK